MGDHEDFGTAIGTRREQRQRPLAVSLGEATAAAAGVGHLPAAAQAEAARRRPPPRTAAVRWLGDRVLRALGWHAERPRGRVAVWARAAGPGHRHRLCAGG